MGIIIGKLVRKLGVSSRVDFGGLDREIRGVYCKMNGMSKKEKYVLFNNLADHVYSVIRSVFSNYIVEFNIKRKGVSIYKTRSYRIGSTSLHVYSYGKYDILITITPINLNQIFSKGFYLWTYGVYGSNEQLTINLTNTTTALYQLTLPPSNISWWPEPASVTNTFSNISSDTSLTVGFSGLLDPGTKNDTFSQNTILGQCNGIYNLMLGLKCASIGGSTLSWTSEAITAILNAVLSDQFLNYDVLCFDVEAGNAGLSSSFENLFAACKNKGYIVFVTISHSAPYAFPDAATIMQGFFSSMNIDAISPQMYTFDFGTTNEYEPNAALTWSSFSQYYLARNNPNMIIAPSIFSGVTANGTYDLFNTGGTNNVLQPINYTDPNYPIDTGSKDFFKAYNISSPGYIAWINGNISPV